jgi:hypothetical protein
MKFFAVLFFIYSLAKIRGDFTEESFQISRSILPQTNDQLLELARRFQIFEHLAYILNQKEILKIDNDVNFPIITPPADPIILEPTNITLDLDIISGDFLLRKGTIEGLSTLKDDLAVVVSLPPLKLNYTLNISAFSFNGDYDADMFSDLTQFGYPTTPITGHGEFYANVTEFWFDLDVLIGIPFLSNRIFIRELHLDFGFENIGLFFENALLYGEPIDYWDDINKGLKAVFTYAWSNNREDIQESLRLLLDYLVKDCTLRNIIEIIAGSGDFSCLNLPALPTQAPETTKEPEEPSTIPSTQPPKPTPSTIDPPAQGSAPNMRTIQPGILAILIVSVLQL